MKKNWKILKLADLCSIELGRTPSRCNASLWDTKRETGNVWLSISDLLQSEGNIVFNSKEYISDKGVLGAKIVRKGTLLVSFKLTLGRLAFAGCDLYTNEAIAALTIFNDLTLSKEYLFYFLHFFDWNKAAEGDEKIKGKTLNKAKLKEIPVLVPPLPEQKRIVAILDEAFAGIATATANAEKNLANARELFDSQLRALFDGGHGAWERKLLRQVAVNFGRGKSRHRPRNDPKLYGGKYPFIQTGDVRNCDHVIMESSQTYNELGLSQSKLWPKGTICITIAANIAETGILGFDACFPDSIIGMVVDPKQTTNDFAEYLLRTVQAELKAEGKGSAQDNINLATFEDRLFPFPDLEKQARIVEKLNKLSAQVQNLEAIYLKKLTELANLKQAILRQAFSGDLTAASATSLQEVAA